MNRSAWRVVLAGALAIGLGAGALVATSPTAGADRPIVRATLRTTSGAEIGEVVFTGRRNMVSRVEVEVFAPAIVGLGDFHGFHVHTTGVCGPAGDPPVAFGAAGGHWNPGGSSVGHGAHKGDMPSVLVGANGRAYAEFDTGRFDARDLLDADGSAVILHVGRDNFANILPTYSYTNGVAGPDPETTGKTGDAGGRYACGVVESAADDDD